jgi:hypothetical protein
MFDETHQVRETVTIVPGALEEVLADARNHTIAHSLKSFELWRRNVRVHRESLDPFAVGERDD